MKNLSLLVLLICMSQTFAADLNTANDLLKNSDSLFQCLDVVPRDEKTLNSERFLANRELKDAIEMEQEYLNLAIPASKRSGYLKLAGSALLFVPSWGASVYIWEKVGKNLFLYLSYPGSHLPVAAATLLSLGITLSPMLADVYIGVDGMIDLLQKEFDLDLELVEKLREEHAQRGNQSCSFSKAKDELYSFRDQVLEKELSGKLNAVKDFIFMGTILKEATMKLLLIATQQRILAELKVTALNRL